MTDKERMTDLILTEKKMTTNYNTFASECTNTKLRDAFLNMIRSGHTTATQLFDEAMNRGWFTTTPADGAQIAQAYQTYSSMN